MGRVHFSMAARATGGPLGPLLAVLLGAAVARADGHIVGTVSTDGGLAVSDTLVIAYTTQPWVERTARTDDQGRFQLRQLPPGTYTLRVLRHGYKEFRRQELPLHIDRTLELRIRLEPDFQDEFLVGLPPEFVPATPRAELTLDPAALPFLPATPPTGKGGLVRSFDGLLDRLPNTQAETYGVSIQGASPFEHRYVLDGLSIQDPRLGVNALPLSVELLENVELLTGGTLAEDGHTSGGVIRAHTRTGFDTFHGSVFGTWVPGLLGATPPPTSGPTWTVRGQNRVAFQGDVGATLGGPVVRDRLWFFAGVAPARSRVEHTRSLAARDPEAPAEDPGQPFGTPRTFLAQERALQALGKLTYQPHQDHRVSLTLITTPTTSGGEGQLPVDPLTGRVRDVLNADPSSLGTHVFEGNTSLAGLSYSGALLDHRIEVEARLGWLRRTASERVDPSGLPYRGNRARRSLLDLEPEPTALEACAPEALARCPVTFYEVGSEPFTAQDTRDRVQAHVQVLGKWSVWGRHTTRVGLSVERLVSEGLTSTGPETSPSATRTASTLLGGFARDTWHLGYRTALHVGLRYDLQRLEKRDQDLSYAPAPRLSPSLGLVVDPLGTTRLRLWAHQAWHVTQVPLGVLDGPFDATRVEPELVLPSSRELLVGGEYKLFQDSHVSATYTRRDLDAALLRLGNGDTSFLGNPGQGIAREFPKAERTFDAVTVAFNHTRYGDAWAQVSYTWSRLYGNLEGPFEQDLRWGQPRLQPTAWGPSRVDGASGLLPSDRTHTVKLLGARRYHFTRRFSASLGGVYRGRSGTPIEALRETRQGAEDTRFALPRGSLGTRTPWVHDLDLRAVADYRVYREVHVSFSLEVFNLFNFQAVTRVNEDYTAADGPSPGPEFGKPIQYQLPRQVRLGLGCTF